MTTVKLSLYHPEEMEAFAAFLTTAAAAKRKRDAEEPAFGLGRIAGNDSWQNRALSDDKTASEAAAEPEPEQPRRTRGRPKKSDLPSEVVAEAKAAGVNVSDQPGGADVVAEQQAEVAPETEAEAEAPALTETDVRNAIIDVLNAVVQKHEDDPDIRVKTLKPLLASVDAEKISSIKPERYADVMEKLAEIKAMEGIE